VSKRSWSNTLPCLSLGLDRFPKFWLDQIHDSQRSPADVWRRDVRCGHHGETQWPSMTRPYARWPAVFQVSSDPESARTPLPSTHDCRASDTTNESQFAISSVHGSSDVTRSSLWDGQVDFRHFCTLNLDTELETVGCYCARLLQHWIKQAEKKFRCWESRGARAPVPHTWWCQC